MSVTKQNTISSDISTAAVNASAAASAAANAASKAADNAAIAARAAAESATAIAVVATDTSWMKKSLEGIEVTLNEMNKAFVTAAQHAELLKVTDNHEIRINALETTGTRLTVMLSIGIGVLSLLTSLLIYHLFQN
jgi:hypothetical protein